MILDEPDEDADALEDEDMLASYLVSDGPNQDSPKRPSAVEFADWPPPAGVQKGAPVLDPLALAWFESHHANWHPGMKEILRAWIDARTQAASPESATVDDAAAGQADHVTPATLDGR